MGHPIQKRLQIKLTRNSIKIAKNHVVIDQIMPKLNQNGPNLDVFCLKRSNSYMGHTVEGWPNDVTLV